MQEKVNKVQNYLKLMGLSQVELALKAGVSQSTVSRAISVEPENHVRFGGAREKLIKYIEDSQFKKPEMNGTDPRMKIVTAFEKIWDKSDAHIEAVVKVIQALDELEPKHKKGDK